MWPYSGQPAECKAKPRKPPDIRRPGDSVSALWRNTKMSGDIAETLVAIAAFLVEFVHEKINQEFPMKTVFAPVAALAALLGATSAMAAPVTYQFDPDHSQVVFEYTHMGFSTSTGIINGLTGTLVLDAENPAASTVEATIPMAGLHTVAEALDGHLFGPDFFNTDKAAAVEVSSSVKANHRALRSRICLSSNGAKWTKLHAPGTPRAPNPRGRLVQTTDAPFAWTNVTSRSNATRACPGVIASSSPSTSKRTSELRKERSKSAWRSSKPCRCSQSRK